MKQEDNIQHSIPENSCFFQGHKTQFFTKNKISFRITKNNEDIDELEKINIARYKRTLFRNLHKRIDERNKVNGSISNPKDKDISIKYIKLVDSSLEDEICGYYDIYPNTAMCKEPNCNQYFDLKRDKSCGHNEYKWEQINFVAFCDECGRVIPLQYASNLGYNCLKCKGENTLTILDWIRKDDLGSYKIECKRCHNKIGLYFHKCNHVDTYSKEKLSNEVPLRFRAVPARTGTIIHPVVVTIPDILDDHDGSSIHERKSASDNFNHFFPNIDESILNVPKLKELVINDSEFWKQKGVAFLAEEKEIAPKSLKDLDGQLKFKLFIKSLLSRAKDINHPEIYGIYNLERAISQIPYRINLDEDWEGISLLDQKDTYIDSLVSNQEEKMKTYGKDRLYAVRSIPSSIPEEEYKSWLTDNNLKRIKHVSGLNMIQALIGIIEGSTRNKVPLFNIISTGKKNHQRPTIYVRRFFTEGIVFQLEYKAVLKWFQSNQHLISQETIEWNEDGDPEIIYQEIIRNNEQYKDAAYKLLHTLSHMLMEQSTIHTGLELQSLSEKIYPMVVSIFIYSTNNINIGGLESTFDSDIKNWFERMYDLASDCPQDPSCMIDEGGACNACSYVPEFVCENFNQNLDRSVLIGKSDRFSRGFFDDYKSSS